MACRTYHSNELLLKVHNILQTNATSETFNAVKCGFITIAEMNRVYKY